MTYTPEELRAGEAIKALVKNHPHHHQQPWSGEIGVYGAPNEFDLAKAALDAVLPGYTQRIQADQYTELQRMIVGVHVVDGRPDLFSVVVKADAWDAHRAAALAAPVEQDPPPCTCSPPMYDGDDGYNRECPAHGADPSHVAAPPVEYHGDGVPNTVLHDLRAIMAALGIDDYARPYSPHEVVQREVLPAIERLRPAPPVEQPHNGHKHGEG